MSEPMKTTVVEVPKAAKLKNMYDQAHEISETLRSPDNRFLVEAEELVSSKQVGEGLLKEVAAFLVEESEHFVKLAMIFRKYEAGNLEGGQHTLQQAIASNQLANTLEGTTLSLQKEGKLLDQLLAALDPDKQGQIDLKKLAEVEQDLTKQASVLDAILMTIGAPEGEARKIKSAQEAEIEKNREKYRKKTEELYGNAAERHTETDPNFQPEKIQKRIEKAFNKDYRPLEVALSTRQCPDHPGQMFVRIADGVYQCSMDNHIYDYNTGFTSLKGNKVPGGNVANADRFAEQTTHETSFQTREQRSQQNVID